MNKKEKEANELDWGKALNHLRDMRSVAQALGWTGMFYVMGCNELLARYEHGERTEELYNAMIELH